MRRAKYGNVDRSAEAAHRVRLALEELQDDALRAGLPLTAHLAGVAAESAADVALARSRRVAADRRGG